MLQHTPISTQINFFTERFNEGPYRLTDTCTLKKPHGIVIEAHGPWHGIDFKILINDDDVHAQSAQQGGKGSANRAVSNNGNFMHGVAQTCEVGALA
jgi:hypothetical protein